jgi:fructokinase
LAPYGGIELGGTKCVLAVGDGADGAWATAVIPTRDPVTTLKAAVDWFRDIEQGSGPLASLGIASFGPLDLGPGAITNATPKTPWRGCLVRAAFEEGLGVSTQIETDVNAAALAEVAWGAAQGCSDMCYVTIGTGIGVGTIANGSLVHGRSHPEAGHMRIPQHAADCQPGSPGQMWAGNCVIHGSCWEGLAAGTARASRSALWAEHSLQQPDRQMLESEYVALGLSNLIASYRPERVVIGGGVMHEEGLLARTRSRVTELLDPEYFPETQKMEDLVVGPGLGDAAGVSGAILLAAQLTGADLQRHSMARLASQIRTGQ